MEYRLVRHTDRFEDAVAFWTDLLGWPITRQWPDEGGGRGCIVGYGDVGRLELIESPHAEPVSGLFVSFQYDAVDALHDRLAAAGVPILQPPTDQPWGHRSVRFRDPSGIEVVAFRWI